MTNGWLLYLLGALGTLFWGTADFIIAVRVGAITITSDNDTGMLRMRLMIFHGIVASAAIWPLTLPLKLYNLAEAIREGGGSTMTLDHTSPYPPPEQYEEQFRKVIDVCNECLPKALPPWANELVIADALLAVALGQVRWRHEKDGHADTQARRHFLALAQRRAKVEPDGSVIEKPELS